MVSLGVPEAPKFAVLNSSWKQRISSKWSFPVKAMDLDEALTGVPQAGAIYASFSHGYRLALKWARTGRYPLLEGHYAFGRGHPEPLWRVVVLPVPRGFRHEASILLDVRGLPALRAWFLRAFASAGMEGESSITISFEPGTDEPFLEYHNSLLPQVSGHA